MADNHSKPPHSSTGAPRAQEPASSVAFSVSAKGAVLEVSWTNGSGAPIKIATHVFAGDKHFDWIEVTLTDRAGAPRRLRFVDDRDESGKVLVDLAPGASARESIDLAAWARRKANGKTPLAAGSYSAVVVYDSSRETRGFAGRLEARTTVTVP